MNIWEKINEAIDEIDELSGTVINKDDVLGDRISSLSFIMLLMKVEEKFGIEINEDDLNYDTFKTLSDIEKYVERLI